jgi:DNA-binding transcriptional ArsR family regulator
VTATLDARTAWPLYVGMTVAGAAAVVASASTLAALARAAGWSGWTPWLLPASLDVGGSVGGWVWLRPSAPRRARRAGRVVALAGAVTSLVGNGAGHLITTGYLHPGPALVVIVGAVPAAVLVALAHLAALVAQIEQPEPAGEADPAPDQPLLTEADEQDTEPQDDDSRRSEPQDDVQPTTEVDTRVAVLTAIQTRPATVADLVKTTGRSRTTVVGHLTALAEDGVITRDDDKRYRPLTRPHAVQDRQDPEESAS